ncbi:SDR family NAD(P)-dependent oxidoreductase [Kriegella aquimaris]|uniref:3-oxoacyl-[acyl-carrier protein] reductase n=1 Tax=Kriegella aquimaris TaxID=192904 RepID=A0A1G9Y7T1_9FLAO|nr:SDR family oxidoreductase [Kriegella aquimaris]SDN05138.1 3-oxoacyl-[acyl-carrier protein] reductase [Kriegella aquimaris]
MNYSGIKNKAAIVTGAGEGIGYAIAELLLKAGANVVLNDLDETRSQKAAGELHNKHPGNCLAFSGDAGDIAIINAMADFTLENFGKIDFIIPNAGITLFGDFLSFTPESFQKVLQLNLHGAFFLVQRAAKEMIKNGNGGRIVLMSSQVGIQAYRNLTAYGMTKAALQLMARNLAYELGEYGITINAIAPGATLTERTKKEQPDYEGIWGKLIPRGVVGKPEDIAKTCVFLLSEEAAHINGQTIPVDGGWTTAGIYPEDLS